MNSSRKLILGTVLCTLFFTLANSLKAGDCEVCIATIEKFVNTLDEAVKKDPKKIEEQFKKFCKGSKNKENRFVSITVNFSLKMLFSDVSFSI
jgi:hypothetical protein